ncbi:MAG: fibrillarin-like rRNA/tRNA 2'-O-methyltransferase [Methanoregulaceae archaeon]|nr:fibrillarin-like rRNA/tRNA 2'-O-methyltransferase [Methanoregulaceae archaeon]
MIWVSGVLVSPGEGGVYGERILQGYRIWDPYRSKLAALFYTGQGVELEPRHRVLYLGAANGTTVSHVADYVDTVYAVEFAPKPMQDLLMVAGRRKNIVPIMADASRPEFYAPLVERIDLLYQDVAQPDQAGIALKNAIFLKEGGTMIVMLKTRSIDVRADPGKVLARTCGVFSETGIRVERTCWLNPYHKDHAVLICMKI